MAAASYSFLDIAVLGDVRARFATGDALVILSTDLEEVIWANGPGAALFGYSDIMAAMGAPSELAIATKRQIAATGGFPAIRRDRPILLRMTAGLSSQATRFLVSQISLPDGEAAILLAAPAAAGGGRSDAEIANRAIAGFAEAGHFVAFVDGRGSVEASSDGFHELGMDSRTLASLASGLAEGHIARRLIPGARGQLPTGIARLTEDRLLVVVVDEDLAAEAPLTGIRAASPSTMAQDGGEALGAESQRHEAQPATAGDPPFEPVRHASAGHENGEQRHAAGEVSPAARPEDDEAPTEARHEGVDSQRDENPAGRSPASSSPRREAEAADSTGQSGSEPAGGAAAPMQAEAAEAGSGPARIPAHPADGGRAPGPAAPVQEAAEAQTRLGAAADPPKPQDAQADAARKPGFDRAAAPIRFVWRTDAEGRLSQISPEFSAAVGHSAADVVGRRFKDIAEALGLDPSGEIAGLLARRDTWSGRSVMWPVAGTDLRIPVDLAALPVYDRSRNFEGFRGFGVARAGDAVADPQASGRASVAGDPAADEAPGQDAAGSVTLHGPFEGEAPVPEDGLEPERRHGDKVIRLAEHRQPANGKELSSSERTAFQQIAERLRKESGVTAGGLPAAERILDIIPPQEPAADAGPGTQAEGGAVDRPAGGTGSPEVEPGGSTSDAAPDRVDPTAAEEKMVAGPSAVTDAERGRAVTGDPQAAASAGNAPSPDAAGPTPGASGVPPAAETRRESGGMKAAPRKPRRPGVSLLDFAKWDGDRPHGKASAESSGEAEPSPGAEAPGDAPSRHSGPGAEPFPRLRTPEPRRFPAEPGGAAEALPQGKTPADDPARTQGQDKDPVSRLRAPEARRIPAEGEATAPPETAGFDPVHKSQAAPDETATTEHRDDPSAEIMTAARPVDAAAASGGRPQAEDADVPAAAAPLEGTGDRPASLPAAGVGAKLPEPESYAPATSRPATPPQERRGNDVSVLEKLPVPVLVHSGDALHYANAEFLTLTGYGSVAELAEAGGIGALFVDPFDGENQPELRDRQLLLRKRQGEEFPVKAFLQSVPWNGGKALLLVLERSLAGPGAGQSPLVEELEAHVAEMRTIIDTATDGVVLIALDGTIRSISRPAEALFGFDSDEVAGKPFASLFAIESQRAARDYLAGLSDHGVASVLNDGREVIGREAEGRFIPLFMTIGRLPAGSGYCAVVRDITQWKRAEEDLTKARATAERASAHKTEFLARISHEIRTPLNAIIGFSELMMDEKFGPVANDRYRDYLRDINRSGNHVLDLVNDLLDISKIEAGQQDMAYEAVSLNETLAETVAMMQPQANRERVIIRSSLASRLPDVVADLRSVRQIALNLLSNAVRYTQAGGQVIVSTSYEPAGEVVMRVRDTGIGMTQAEIEQALKPFKQITSLKRARGDGTGLGLPLTKAMVEANRAKFSIHSTPGEGTLVEVSFPSTRVLAQ